jgi:hypothetical protein
MSDSTHLTAIVLPADTIADHTACIVLDLVKTFEQVAPDIALTLELPEGQGVEVAIEEALLARLTTLLNKPGLSIADLTPDGIKEALGAAVSLVD